MLSLLMIALLAGGVMSLAMLSGAYLVANRKRMSFLCWLGAFIGLMTLLFIMFLSGYTAGYHDRSKPYNKPGNSIECQEIQKA